MIPISLTIKGLFSYQREQRIYFDRLIEGQLFGIFGAVGSGKSSILEAIAFALYGETERLNTRDDRNYNMMNLKSDELLIDFSFANFDDKQYRFIVKGRRNGKRFDKVSAFERAAYCQINGIWEPLAENTAESIIGLSYENFRRTIIIPQGKFQEFLQLTDKARTDMLKDIFQLNKYEFFHQTASLERKNNEILQRLSGRLSGYEEVTMDVLVEAEDFLKEIGGILESLNNEFVRIENDAKNLESRKRLFEELYRVENEYNALQLKRKEYEDLRANLSDYEYCERHFKADLQRLEELQIGIRKRDESLRDYQHKLKLCDTALMELQQEYATISLKHQELEQLNLKKVDYLTGIQIRKERDEIDLLNDRITKGSVFLDRANLEKGRLEKEAANLRDRLQIKKEEKPDISALAEVKSWFVQQKIYKKAVQDNLAALSDVDNALTGIEQSIEKLILDELTSIPQDHEAALKNRKNELSQSLEDHQEHMNHLQLQVKLGDFAAALHRGEACPLCGSLEHPQIIALDDVELQLKELNNRCQQLKTDKLRVEETIQTLNILKANKLTELKKKEEIQHKHSTDVEILEQHVKLFVWENFDQENHESIDELLNAYKLLEGEMERLEKALDVNETQRKKVEADRIQYENAIRKIVENERIKTGSLNLLMKQLKIVSLEEIETLSIEGLSAEVMRIDREVETVVKTHHALQNALQEQQQLKITLDTRLNSVMESLTAEGERLVFVEQQLGTALGKSKFSNIDDVKALLALPIMVDEVRNEMETFFRKLFNAKELYEKLDEQLQGEDFDEERFVEVLKLQQSLRERIQEEQERYIGAKNGRERLLKQLKEKQTLLHTLEEVQRRAQNLNMLKNLFKGSGFVSYISSVYLQQLCDVANKRFYKLTQQQLKLEINERNEFQVRDYLNDGKLRLAKTLSGGQTFQASLSLALALAESVQQQNRAKQNFFFLDEGFGSLDKESLAVAFDTLKTLRNENRIVGIISHVDELKQEIDVYLQVKNDPITGTETAGNWESHPSSF